jgi:hypothetical protein
MGTTISVPSGLSGKVLWKKVLLICGIVSSVVYVAVNMYVPAQYPGYQIASQTVSELSAIGAPTRTLWVILLSFYTLLIVAFGWGVWISAAGNRWLKIAGFLLIVYAIIGLAWPPMHQREVLAAGGGTITDTMHIVFTIVSVLLMLLVIGFAAASLGKPFLIFSVLSIVVMLSFGLMTGLDAPKMEANLATPWIGVWERISIGAYMLWVAVFGLVLLKR